MSTGSVEVRCRAGAPLLGLLVLLLAAARPLSPAPAAPVPWHVTAALPGYVRILLGSGPTVSVGGKLQWLDGLKVLGITEDATAVSATDGLLRLRLADKAHATKQLVAVPLDGLAAYNGRSYRGRLELHLDAQGEVALLNILPLEDYLCGVVPCEMPAAWPADALRAQAIAARTYAVTRLQDKAAADYDLLATVADQEYHGASGEAATATQAVHDTAGLILVYGGVPIAALYCADAGGCTACGKFPYLQAVYSFAPESKHNRWELPVTLAGLVQLARKQGQDIGTPRSVRTENDPVSGHLTSLLLTGDKGEWRVGGKELRSLLGTTKLRSPRARLYPAAAPGDPPPPAQADASGRALKCFAPDSGIQSTDGIAASNAGQAPLVTEISAADAQAGLVFVGSGNGHGVGMSQYGAAELAKQGWNYRDILLYFYRGVQFAQLPGNFTAISSDTSNDAKPDEGDATAVGFYEPFRQKAH